MTDTKEAGVKEGTNSAALECDKVSAIIKQRSGTHGDAFANLNDIGARWSEYLNKLLAKMDVGEELELNAADIAYLMVEMKLSRACYGDNEEVDHFRDILGYSAIGAAYTTKLNAKKSGIKVSGNTFETPKKK